MGLRTETISSNLDARGRKPRFVTRNPLAGFEKLKEQEWAGRKPSDDVIEAVFTKLNERFLPIFRFISNTGARRGDVPSSQRWQIDRSNHLVEFAKRKKSGKDGAADKAADLAG